MEGKPVALNLVFAACVTAGRQRKRRLPGKLEGFVSPVIRRRESAQARAGTTQAQRVNTCGNRGLVAEGKNARKASNVLCTFQARRISSSFVEMQIHDLLEGAVLRSQRACVSRLCSCVGGKSPKWRRVAFRVTPLCLRTPPRTKETPRLASWRVE